MNATTNTLTNLPTLPARPPAARPWLWGADDARIAARADEASAMQDPRQQADEFEAMMRRALLAT